MLPLDFIDSIQPQLGVELDAFCRALQDAPHTSIRLNDKEVKETNGTLLDTQNLPFVPWSEDGYYLKERPQFTLDPLFHAGCYYVQEASSMFVEEVLYNYLAPDSIVLDLCAAPGGKSTLISQFLGEDGLLVSNEVVRQRVFILSENMQKWGNGNVIVTHNKPADFGKKLPALFDCILIDAPCSGEGMFRKDPQAIAEWSLKNVKVCAERQQSILTDVWNALKPGGILIYSTCTFNEQEDEKNAEFIVNELGAEILPVSTEPEWNIVETTGYHFYPHKAKGEGFYLCAFRKNDNAPITAAPKEDKRRQKDRFQQIKPTKEMVAAIQAWLNKPDEWEINADERFVSVYPKAFKETIELIHSRMICITTGIGVGELRGRTLAPQHHLAMAKALNKAAFPRVELPLETALNYLRGEAIVLENQPLGYLLMTYKGVPLGFAKNIGNHCNNLYPNEWRIKKL